MRKITRRRAIGALVSVSASPSLAQTAAMAPAAVSAPVQGSALTAVWNLQSGGTGSAAGARQGAWSGKLAGDAYLSGKGFVKSNLSGLFLDAGPRSVAIANYDFSGCPAISITGTGTVTFTNCTFTLSAPPPGHAAVNFPCNINGDIDYNAGALKISFVNCSFVKAATFVMGSGTCVFSYCRFSGQKQGLGDVGYNGTGFASLTFDHCYITGGGVAPAPNAHVELTQFARKPTGGTSCTISNCMIDISRDGQTTAARWGSAWTGVFSIGVPLVASNSIIIGAAAVNANAANRNVVDTLFQYGDAYPPTITNCVLEPGCIGSGYSLNGSSGKHRPTVSGCRSIRNVALKADSFD
ncbi:MAG: hypothetical protein JSR98_19505 [Proteobacteria bacterium]|nr:hypothetical protein [Pseudomonadota bacterium]